MKTSHFFIFKHSSNPRRSHKGFVGVVFLAVALIGIIIGSIAKMSRESSGAPSDQANKMAASIILKQASDIASAFDRLDVEGKVSNDPITTRAAGAPYAPAYRMPVGSYLVYNTPGFDGSGYVLFSNLKKVTLSEAETQVLFAEAPLRDEVCRQINLLLHGDAVTSTPPAGDLTYFEYLADDMPSAGGGVDPRLSRPEGCIYDGEGIALYYRVLR